MLNIRTATACVAIMLSVVATIIMSYIAMATPIGPWIETTLVLLSMLIFSGTVQKSREYMNAVGLSTAAGGIGGILATAVAFSLPTLFFVAPETFAAWMQNIPRFCITFSGFAFVAGSFGLLMADLFETKLLSQPQLKFPIGELIHATISAPEQLYKSVELAAGFIGTQLLLYAQSFFKIGGNVFTLITQKNWWLFSIPHITLPLNQLPLFLAVGFVTGHVIALPLLAGLSAKIFCIDPLYTIYTTYITHQKLSSHEFMFAFCSGIVLYGAALSIYGLPKLLKKYISSLQRYTSGHDLTTNFYSSILHKKRDLLKALGIIGLNIACLSYFRFPWLSQLYLLLFSALWVYQMLMIAGSLGIIPLGRFATFIMVPSLFLFDLSMIQITLTAAFVEIAGGVAGDTLFGRKMAALGSIEHQRVVRYQWLGLLISSLVIGIVFWLFINHFGLGPTGLPVTKAASRALLITFTHGDGYVLLLGTLFGLCLHYTRINAALLLGGILMPPSISIMLIAGGLLTFVTKKSEAYYPFLSGVSAGNSLWMLIDIFFK